MLGAHPVTPHHLEHLSRPLSLQQHWTLEEQNTFLTEIMLWCGIFPRKPYSLIQNRLNWLSDLSASIKHVDEMLYRSVTPNNENMAKAEEGEEAWSSV